MSFYNKDSQKRTSFFTIIIVAIISAIVGGIITTVIAPTYLYGKYIPYPDIYRKNISQDIEIITKGKDINVIPEVVKKAIPSVVGIKTTTFERDFFFGVRRGQGVGTGVIVDNKGYILTNSHVVDEKRAEDVRVLLYDGRELKADVLWNDPFLDLAILKIKAQDLSVACLGDSDKLEVGQLAIAIGNPLGLAFERTVTSGIISGLERSIEISQFESIEGLIQTDASINPGNSGGPLLNSEGEVVGINTVKIKTGEGLGFAIPINIAKPIVDEFIKKGEFRKVYLGIRGMNVREYMMDYGYDLGVDEGIFVYQVLPNSPVYKAGMQDKDVIISIDNKPVDSMISLVRRLYKYRPGDKIQVEVLRGSNKIKLKVILEAMPNGK
ncbi:trypsin-like serine protease [Crassaminicella thermophila]|uniref:Trypsin-like serine protease n=1 Tax=Crassaminicella thermophila TaxID=2599308 RepID=A0A5C0SG68_CRATE|nr:trypsin-like peptidase domain-containing protein [Crassaminicella thermophila]QEK13483.1 trypsin-like serine protease [Crassaminicella thermophila]